LIVPINFIQIQFSISSCNYDLEDQALIATGHAKHLTPG
jgi:hypothetical protein